MIGVIIGCLLGLLVADRVVRWIEGPLISALKIHYSESARLELQSHYAGTPPKEFEKFVQEKGLIVEEVYFERQELARLVTSSGAEASPPQATVSAATAANDLGYLPQNPDLIKTRLWRPSQARLTTLNPQESFMIWMKAAFVTGVILVCPYVFYQIWAFVAAGLYPHEKRYVHIFLPFSVALFLAGAAVAFFFAFGPVLNFLFGFSRLLNIDPDLRISEVISFILILPLGFGIAFQLPLVMLFINRIGIISVGTYLEKWRIAILAVFVISMVLTPADPISMLLMALPLSVLYFLGIGLCKWLPRNRNPFVEAYES